MVKYKLIIDKHDWPFFIAIIFLLILLAISVLKQI